MENVDMKTGPETGAAGMAGSAASPHLLYFVILSVFRAVCGSIFGRLQAVGRYVRHPQGRRARRALVLPLPTLCLALAFVFFNAVGAMAQDVDCSGNPTAPVCTNPLFAEAGDPETWNSGVTVTLDGSGSMDDEDGGKIGMITGYAWERTGGTVNFDVADLTGENPTFVADTRMPGTDDVEHTFTLTVTDDDTFTKTDMVTITINAPPEAVVDGNADNATKEVNSGHPNPVTLDGRMSNDFSTDSLMYSWTRTGGSTGVTVPSPTGTATDMLTFAAGTLVATGPDDVTHEYTLTVTDEGGKASPTDTATPLTDTVVVTITVSPPPNVPPVADAGMPATWNSGVTVTLDGGDSTDDGGMITDYDWERTDGTENFDVADLTGENPTFVADTRMPGTDDVEHTFTLTVTDDQDETHTDMVTITINAPPEAVVDGNADNATKEVNSGHPNPVTLDGRMSNDFSTDSLMYSWTRTGGSTGVTVPSPTGTATDMLTFAAGTLVATGPDDVTHEYTLTVTDEGGKASPTDTATPLTDTVVVTITVSPPPNVPPVADAGMPATWNSGVTVTLDGGDSTDDGGMITDYDWERTDGTENFDVADLTGENPTFVADTRMPGTDDVEHTFTLTVTDDQDETHTDMVTITINAPPEAVVDGNADNATKEVNSGHPNPVTLDGRMSNDFSTDSLMYSWTRTGGSTGVTVPSPTGTATDTLTFAAGTLVATGPDDVTHEYTLTVTDEGGKASPTDTATPLTDTVVVTITVSPPPNVPPVADAGMPATWNSGVTVTLDGGDSTDDGGMITDYDWERTDGTENFDVADLTGENPTFVADTRMPGTDDVEHTFTLTVTDDQDETHTDMVTITINAPPEAVVDGNADNATKEVNSGHPNPVTLDGRMSNDFSTDSLMYSWTRTGGSTGVTVPSPTGTATDMLTFAAGTLVATGPDDVTHEYTLTVTDEGGKASPTDTATPLTDTVVVTITVSPPPNVPPVADAGMPATWNSGVTVTLDGGDSTDDGGMITDYDWERTDGTENFDVADLTGENPTFVADTRMPGTDDVEHTFTLTVTDDQDETHTDMVTITINAPPEAVVDGNADNATKEVNSGHPNPVTLDGRMSNDFSTDSLMYSWTRTGGSTGVTVPSPTGTATDTLTFAAGTLVATGPDDVTHEYTLTVTDEGGKASPTDTATPLTDTVVVTITVSPLPNAAPVANAGEDDTVRSGESVSLTGSGTDIDSDDATLAYAWTRTGGTGGSLTDANKATASFMAPALNPGVADEVHIFTLTVTDEEGATDTDTVEITVKAASVDIVVSPPEVSVQEGSSGTYQVRLSEAPRREVTVMATSGNEDVVRLKDTPLVFNAENWNDWQEVEINSVAGSVNKDDRIKVIIQHSLDGAASAKLAVVTVSVRAQEDDPIPDLVGQFIATRATVLLNTQPDLTRFLKQDEPTPGDGGAFTFQVTDGRLALDGGFIHNGVWGEVTGAWANSESGDTRSVLGSFGIHRKYSETFLAGALLQLDLADHDLPGQTGTIDGTGWLVGPYFVARHGSQPLYFEGRLLYGQSGNDIRFIDPFLGVRTGSFDSKRLLAQIRVEGEIAVRGWDHGDDGGEDAPRLIPYADMRWIEDRAEAFTTVSATGSRVPVPGQTVNVSTLELGSNIQFPVAVNHGAMTLTGGLGLVYSNTEGDHINSVSRGRGRGEFGFSYGLDENVQIDFESFYDGIGASGYEGYGLSLNAEMRF